MYNIVFISYLPNVIYNKLLSEVKTSNSLLESKTMYAYTNHAPQRIPIKINEF